MNIGWLHLRAWHSESIDVRIITGKYKGRQLTTVRDNSVRPATDRVKGSIFNVLQNRLALQDAVVLDLFAGSGSLGFEALSRGAGQVVFVDGSSAALDAVEENAEELDCLDSCELVEDDALSFIRREHREFDLIFADPPYAWESIPLLPVEIVTRKLLKKQGFLIIEHSKQTEFQSNENYKLSVRKEFGNTRVSFFTIQEQDGL